MAAAGLRAHYLDLRLTYNTSSATQTDRRIAYLGMASLLDSLNYLIGAGCLLSAAADVRSFRTLRVTVQQFLMLHQ